MVWKPTKMPSLMIGNCRVLTPSSSYPHVERLSGRVRSPKNVDDLRADLELAELLGRQEAGAGVVRLITERTIKLGRMADRLVDRQPEVGGQQAPGP